MSGLTTARPQSHRILPAWAPGGTLFFSRRRTSLTGEKKLVGKHVRAFESSRAGRSRADNESERAGSSRDGAHNQPEQVMAPAGNGRRASADVQLTMARWLLRLALWSKRSKSKVAAETAPVARDAVKAMEDEPVVEEP